MFIDSHCHLDFSEFNDTRKQLINECHQKGIKHFIVPGVSLAQSKKLISFAKAYPSVRISAGLHPYFLAQHIQNKQNDHLRELSHFAEANKAHLIAIGECGLDRSIGEFEKQTLLFEGQIDLANQLALPLIVHHRQSHDLIAQSFKRCKPKLGGVIHAFSGSIQQAQYYIKQGFKLGVGGVITYQRAQKTRHVIAQLDAKHLMLETDAPSMPLAGFQGKLNTPRQIVPVFLALCQLKQLDNEQARARLAKQLYESCSEVFRI